MKRIVTVIETLITIISVEVSLPPVVLISVDVILPVVVVIEIMNLKLIPLELILNDACARNCTWTTRFSVVYAPITSRRRACIGSCTQTFSFVAKGTSVILYRQLCYSVLT